MVETDNKGAWELCHKYTSAQHTRHIDRKLFKLREMRGAGIVKVQYIPAVPRGRLQQTAQLLVRGVQVTASVLSHLPVVRGAWRLLPGPTQSPRGRLRLTHTCGSRRILTEGRDPHLLTSVHS